MPERPPDQLPGRPPVQLRDTTPEDDLGRARLWRALTQPGRGQLLVGVLLALVGFGAVTQVRATELDDTYSGYREQDLIEVLNGLNGAGQRAETERGRLERTLSELRTSNSRREVALKETRADLDTYNILAGLVPVSGPGIRITATESDGRINVDSMVDLIQELRNAGAEAIGVNDRVRVVAQTAVEPTVAGFSFGDAEVTSPFVIEAIGDPTTLRSGVSFLRGPVEVMRGDGVAVEIEEFDTLDVSEVRQPVKPEYAEPDGT